jgi:uncharacterized protein (TIGR02265 family)
VNAEARGTLDRVSQLTSPTEHPGGRFVEPDWHAPFDPDLELRLVPEDAKISGMFLAPLVAELKRVAPGAAVTRPRYVAFNFYPLREHAQLLLEACRLVYPQRPLRVALRTLGRAAPQAFVASTLGKVVLGSTQGVHDRIAAIAKGYELNLRPGRATVLESGKTRIVVRLEDVHYFLDSHHVGAYEGTMKQAGVAGRVLLADRGRASADLLLEW